MERKFTEDYAARCRAKNELNDKANKAWNEAKRFERAGNKVEAQKKYNEYSEYIQKWIDFDKS